MSNLFSDQRKAENRDRAAYIKRRVSIDDAIAAVGFDSDAGDECPRCHGLGTLDQTKSGESATCGSCEETFDVIAFVRAAKGCGFDEACEILEAECLKAADPRQGTLL